MQEVVIKCERPVPGSIQADKRRNEKYFLGKAVAVGTTFRGTVVYIKESVISIYPRSREIGLLVEPETVHLAVAANYPEGPTGWGRGSGGGRKILVKHIGLRRNAQARYA